MQKKLGKATDQRLAMLKNQVSALLWYGKIETTFTRAKEVQKLADKYITLAANTFEDSVKVTKTRIVKAKGGKTETKIEVTNDGSKKLAARRLLMANLNDLQEVKGDKESKAAYRLRTGDVKHPLMEKLFNEIGPKYAARAKELNQGGGYTTIHKTTVRKGDNAEMAIIELI